MKTGDILAVSAKTPRAKIIQKFQSKEDPESGKYNHTAIILVTAAGEYVVEAGIVNGYKNRASIVIKPLSEYMKLHGEYDLAFFEPVMPVNPLRFEPLLFSYVGIPYDYKLLTHDIPIEILQGLWTGRNYEKGWKRMACHEFVQFIHEQYSKGTFPEYYKGRVYNIFKSKHFKQYEL